MNRATSVRFAGLVLVGLAAGIGAVVLHRPALAVAATALIAIPALALASWRWPELDVEARVSSARLVEGDSCTIVLEIATDSAVAWLDVEIDLGVGLRSGDGLLRRVVALGSGTAVAVTFPVVPTTWGVLAAGRYRIVARDRFGLFSCSTIQTIDQVLRVYPSEARLQGMAQPARTVATLGAHLSHSRGDGCEYADVRAWRPGDRMRTVNWRVSARRGGPWVTERHPDRAAEVVVLVDDTAALGPAGDTTLRRAVQAAMALSEGHLAAQDRVGLLAPGAPLRWVRPRSGVRQLYAIVDTLLDCRLARINGIGRQGSLLLGGLRPGTTIVALTVLAEPRVVEVLVDLRRHGHHVIMVEPDHDVDPMASSTVTTEALARRLWDLERSARRERLRDAGVVTLQWDGAVPLGALLSRASVFSGGRR